MTPKEYVDEIVAGIKELWKLMDISNDRFIRTTDEYHVKAVQKIFNQLYEQGDIYKGEYEGMVLHALRKLSGRDSQLVDGKCPDCGRPVDEAEEESLFLPPVQICRTACMKLYEEHPDFIQPRSAQKRDDQQLHQPGPAGSVRFPHQLQVGHSRRL